MRVEQQPAYVLHARAWRETSLLLEAFTRDHGRVGLVARGVRGTRSRLSRGLLQPLQPLLLDWVARGELGTLAGADAASAPIRLNGDALLAAMYVNELVLRLSVRGDSHARAFAAYADCLARLADGPIAWVLRRFERDFLAELGYGLPLETRADGEPVREGETYAYDVEAGPIPPLPDDPRPRVDGASLLALADDCMPDPNGLAQLRRVMRHVLRHHLGGDLQAWRLAAPRGAASAETAARPPRDIE